VARPRVVIVGLGPAGPSLLTADTVAEFDRIPVRFARTQRHPAASALPADTVYFDSVYVEADELATVYENIAARVAAAAVEHGEVVYAVPGSPLVAEHTVELLRANPTIDCDIHPALSYLDVAWARLGVDPLAAGVRMVDAHRFATDAAGEKGPLLVAQCDRRDVLSDMKLALGDVDLDALAPVTVLQRLGLASESVFTVGWADIDRSFEPDHLTTIWVPEVAAPVAGELVEFYEVIRRLRAECPWDREQTHQSLTRFMIEEAYEAVEAMQRAGAALAEGIDDPDADEALVDELGDVLLQVVLNAAIAEEGGRFTLADVARQAGTKMVRRHPHVFGSVDADSAEQVMLNWEEIKRAERGHDTARSALSGVDPSVPALMYARAMQKAAAAVGFDWPDVAGAVPKIAEELDELMAAGTSDARTDELGDLLFAVVNVARHLGVEPESALRVATAKFASRFALVEQLARERSIAMPDASLSTLDALWDEVKRRSRQV
jgi:tetrapyrrole methylase family protein/MazG family protein